MFCGGRERRRRIGESRVAEAVTEAVERVVRRVEIARDVLRARRAKFDRAPGVLHVVMDRHLADIAREGDRQLA